MKIKLRNPIKAAIKKEGGFKTGMMYAAIAVTVLFLWITWGSSFLMTLIALGFLVCELKAWVWDYLVVKPANKK